MSVVSYQSLSYPSSPIILRDSLGGVLVSSSLPDLLDFLVFSTSASLPQSVLRVVWDLDRFVSSVLPDSIRETLSRYPHRAVFQSYRLYYISGKVFSVSKDHNESNFYALSQFFPDDPEPDSLDQLQQKADLLLATLTNLGIPLPTTLASPVAVASASKMLEGYLDTVPTIFDALESHLGAYEYALQCTPREWLSNYRVGHWGEGACWSYDLASAYPFHASQLLDLRDCYFTKSDSLQDSAYYGFLRGKITVYPDSPLAFCSPFLADRGDGTLVNFTGTRDGYYCLLDEVRYLYRYGLGEFRLSSGWFVRPYNGVRPRLPFAGMMSRFYSERSLSPTASFFLKRVMNGVIGKLLETRKDKDDGIVKYGDLYNPIYHSVITTRTRLQVFDFLAQNDVTPQELIHVGVDGCKLTRYIPLPSQVGMGKWRCQGSQPTIILSPGAILTDVRNYKGMGYSELVEQVREHPAGSSYGDIDLSRLFLNQTRNFPKLPKTGRALLEGKYQSEPTIL